MRRIIYILTASFALLIIWNCEEIDVVELEIDHESKIVVQCELVADEFFDGLYLSRTLPLNEQCDESASEISDATLFLIIDSVQIIPLHYFGSNKYGSVSEFKVRSDQKYELFGLVDDKQIYGKTIIPKSPIISENRFVPEGYLSSIVKSNTGEVYGAIWLMMNDEFTKPFDKAKDFFTITFESDSENKDQLIRTTNLSPEYLSSSYKDKIYIQVFAFDKTYYKYFFTKDNNSPIDDAFSQGGGPIDWNVQGENVIGMFIGIAKTGFINVQP